MGNRPVEQAHKTHYSDPQSGKALRDRYFGLMFGSMKNVFGLVVMEVETELDGVVDWWRAVAPAILAAGPLGKRER